MTRLAFPRLAFQRLALPLCAALIVASCAPTQTDEERQAAFEATATALEQAPEGALVFNIAGPSPVVAPEDFVPANPATYTPAFEVVVTQARARALVRPINARATIGQIEAAANARTGCAATAAPEIYAMVRNNRTNVLLTGAELRSVDWRVPVMLTCS